MIKNFLILNFIGKENQIGLKIKSNFYIHDFDQKTDTAPETQVQCLKMPLLKLMISIISIISYFNGLTPDDPPL